MRDRSKIPWTESSLRNPS